MDNCPDLPRLVLTTKVAAKLGVSEYVVRRMPVRVIPIGNRHYVVLEDLVALLGAKPARLEVDPGSA
jgi:hypothetical protein